MKYTNPETPLLGLIETGPGSPQTKSGVLNYGIHAFSKQDNSLSIEKYTTSCMMT